MMMVVVVVVVVVAESIPSRPQGYYKKLQCYNGGTGEGTWLANHSNNLLCAKLCLKRDKVQRKIYI